MSETVTCNGVPAQEEYVYDIYCLQDRQGSAEVFTDQDWKDVKAYFDDIDDQVRFKRIIGSSIAFFMKYV